MAKKSQDERRPVPGEGDTLVEVVIPAVCEGSRDFLKGETFKTTADRAKALGTAVEIKGKASE